MSPQQEINELKLLSAGRMASMTTSTSSGTAQTTSSAAAAYNPHAYTGQPADLGFNPATTPRSTAVTTPTSSGQYNPSASQAALAALAKQMKAIPQFVILPNSSNAGANPLGGEGPGGGLTPQQLQGAYGANNIVFPGGIQGTGAGQTIAVIDAGDNPGFVATTDPNFASSALGYFDSYFGLPNPPSFQKYDQYGNVTTGVGNLGWGLEIALDVEWAHAMAPMANIELVEGYSSSFSDLGTAARTAATTLGASVVSQSFGGYLDYYGDYSLENYLDQTFYAPALAAEPWCHVSGLDGRRWSGLRANLPVHLAPDRGRGWHHTQRHRQHLGQRDGLERWRRRHRRQPPLHHTDLPAKLVGAVAHGVLSADRSRHLLGRRPRDWRLGV